MVDKSRYRSAAKPTMFETKPPFELAESAYTVRAMLPPNPHVLGPSGQFVGELSAKLEKFDPDTNTWSSISDDTYFFATEQVNVNLKAGKYRFAISNAAGAQLDVTKI